MTKLPISVVMAAYNEEEYIAATIESILAQSFSNFEFIIVNDSSTDNTLQIINSYQDKRIVLLNNKKNLGLPKSLNKGIKKAEGRYIARTDADEISSQDRFAEQIKILEADSKIGVAASWYKLIDKDGKELSKNQIPKDEYTVDDFLEKGPRFCHGSTMIRKSVFKEVGLYRPEFRYAQDLDLWLRIAQHYNFYVIPKYLYQRRLDSAVMEKREQQRVFTAYAKKSALSRREGLADPVAELNKIDLDKLADNISAKDKRAYYYYLISIKKIENGDFLAAQKEILKAIAISPCLIRLWYRLFFNFLPQRVREKAVESVQKILERVVVKNNY